MEHYKNLGGDSHIDAYENGTDYIKVQFKSGAVYLYTYASAGSINIEQMKNLAIQGRGLNTFIDSTVRKAYACKEK